MNLTEHYKKLWYFNFNRLKGDNYASMREYFAELFISDIEEFMPLANKEILDVGGARGEFCRVINSKRGSKAVNLDPAPFEYGQYSGDDLWPDTVRGEADNMPFEDCRFDLVMSRGVFEHIYPEKQESALSEMRRVLKDDGICYITIPPWYSPWAGHGLKPFHYLPFKTAKYLAEKAYGKKVAENSWRERRLFKVTFNGMLKMLNNAGFTVISTKDIHFRIHLLTKLPVLKEIAVPAVAFILKKDKGET